MRGEYRLPGITQDKQILLDYAQADARTGLNTRRRVKRPAELTHGALGCMACMCVHAEVSFLGAYFLGRSFGAKVGCPGDQPVTRATRPNARLCACTRACPRHPSSDLCQQCQLPERDDADLRL